jgi:hypothetical protein
MADVAEILKRLNLEAGGSKSDDVTSVGGRLGYVHPIDKSSSIEIGALGHYAKGKGFKDAGIDRGDVTYSKEFENKHKLRASLGGDAKGISEGKVTYEIPFKKGGKVKKASAPKVRGHGIEKKGKTKGRFV